MPHWKFPLLGDYDLKLKSAHNLMVEYWRPTYLRGKSRQCYIYLLSHKCSLKRWSESCLNLSIILTNREIVIQGGIQLSNTDLSLAQVQVQVHSRSFSLYMSEQDYQKLECTQNAIYDFRYGNFFPRAFVRWSS